jgi:diguanylate cyclase (GGDEF)-like protein
LPQRLLDDHSKRTESIVLLFVLVSNTIVSLLFIPVIYLMFDRSPVVMELGLPILAICITSYLAALLIVSYLGWINVAGNVAQVGIFATAVYAGWLTGGVYSPMLYLLLIPPVFAFVLTNVASGVIWFLVTMATFFSIWYLDEFGIAEPMFMIANEIDDSLMNILLPVTSCIMIMFAIAVYEMNSFKLKRLLAQERNLLAFKATHDPLTGLANREEFNTQIKLAVNNARHSSFPLALVYIDLDGFKPINDTLGHHAGDVVLEVISERLTRIVRGTDTVARLGGDEFAIIFQGVGTEEKITPILEKLLRTIAEDIDLEDGESVSVKGSLGVAFYSENSDSVDSLCRHADAAMYQAKETKNTWRFFQAED